MVQNLLRSPLFSLPRDRGFLTFLFSGGVGACRNVGFDGSTRRRVPVADWPGIVLPLVLGPWPWLWTYDLVIICLGMTSTCILPASIPLLIFWLKPETKRYFGKS